MLTRFHATTKSDVLKMLGTHLEGLSLSGVRRRLERYGPNEIEHKKRSWVWFLMGHFRSPLIVILFVAGMLSIFLDRISDAIIIFLAAFVSVALAFWQEYKSNKSFEKLRASLTKTAVVRREGGEYVVDAIEIVPGDILVLRAGDYIVADARLVEHFHLKTNEAVLTGEWLGVEKSVSKLPEKTHVSDQANMVWAGTLVEEGTGLAVVVKTGGQTELGRIAQELLEEQQTRTPMQKDTVQLARILTFVTLCIMVILFVLGIIRGTDKVDMFLTIVAVAVGIIPEGLPAVMSITLAIGVERIARKKGLIRRLNAAETLGRCTFILTDKTGTLTQAKMEVVSTITEFFSLSRIKKSKDKDAELTLLKIGMLTSEAFVSAESGEQEKKVVGRPTEKALFEAALRVGLDKDFLLSEEPLIDFLPFDPERRFVASLHKKNTRNIIYIAGSPDTLLGLSSFYKTEKTLKKLTFAKKETIVNTYVDEAKKGRRVIAVGFKKTTAKTLKNFDKSNVFENIVFLGLISFHDPIRDDVSQAIQEAQNAGLRIVIITGDQLHTALSVVQRIGLNVLAENVMDGDTLEKLSDKELFGRAESIDLYYRIRPHQKKRIVSLWQNEGEIVAMIGDGVNDAPALQRADIGVALGSGTEVAKEASDLVLTDDSFSTIVATIRQGRIIMDNLRKSIVYLLATNFTEVVLIGLSLVFALPLPILPAQILWNNIVGEGFQSVSLAFEPAEKDVMKRKPQKNKNLLTKQMKSLIFIIGISTDIVLFVLFLWLLQRQLPIEEIRTIMFLGLSLDAISFVFPLKNFHKPLWKINIFNNLYLLAALVFSLAALGFAVLVPFMRSLLSLTIPSFFDLWVVLGLVVVNIVFIEFGKWLFVYRKPGSVRKFLSTVR